MYSNSIKDSIITDTYNRLWGQFALDINILTGSKVVTSVKTVVRQRARRSVGDLIFVQLKAGYRA